MDLPESDSKLQKVRYYSLRLSSEFQGCEAEERDSPACREGNEGIGKQVQMAASCDCNLRLTIPDALASHMESYQT